MRRPKESIKRIWIDKEGYSNYECYRFCFVLCIKTKVYSLSDLDGNVFYVGCTSQSLEARLGCHIANAKSGSGYNHAKNSHISSLGFKVNISILEEKYTTKITSPYSATKEMAQREFFWINHFISNGVNLLNGKKEIQIAISMFGLSDEEILEKPAAVNTA